MRCRILTLVGLWSILFSPIRLLAGQLPANHWELLAISYPPDRKVSVALGGGERTLTSKGLFQVIWRKDAAKMEIEVKNLPAAAEVGWTGQQYVLWAVDREKRAVNLGVVPLRSKDAKWAAQVPFRVFGLLVTAEEDPKATVPGARVALESLLPTDSDLIVPVFRVDVALTPAPSEPRP